ncbi:MAG: pyridoxal-phosphate dependent enzyme [Elusimicrobiota bacterium]
MTGKEQVLENTIKRCREKNIIIPTYKQMINPEKVPEGIKKELNGIGLWDLNPRNLFRITWKNEPVAAGGGFGGVNYIEIPKELTGIKARILMLIGKYFPTGAHKVGAAFGCLVPRLVTGEFDPTTQKAVWPSTGNYCRGGAYDSYLLGCTPIAILPEEMSKERFEWLKELGAEVFATPGCESNVKEIYDKCHELKAERGDKIVILNQFDEIGNSIWHYAVTGSAIEEIFNNEKKEGDRLAAVCLTQGSAGTLGSGEYLKEVFPLIKVVAGEALQCPTLLLTGFGGHRIEGIGDKHVPWIHNLKNTDMVADIDDNACIAVMRLFNEPDGQEFLKGIGVDSTTVDKLNLIGISGIANLISAIKTAKYYEHNENDIIVTTATDSMEMYGSRIEEYRKKDGAYSDKQAAVDYGKYIEGLSIDYLLETDYYSRKRMHNLKYFTWIEQQGKELDELNAQWYKENYWTEQYKTYTALDEKIQEFNDRTGLLKKYS